jgi:hypothetical protein
MMGLYTARRARIPTPPPLGRSELQAMPLSSHPPVSWILRMALTAHPARMRMIPDTGLDETTASPDTVLYSIDTTLQVPHRKVSDYQLTLHH